MTTKVKTSISGRNLCEVSPTVATSSLPGLQEAKSPQGVVRRWDGHPRCYTEEEEEEDNDHPRCYTAVRLPSFQDFDRRGREILAPNQG